MDGKTKYEYDSEREVLIRIEPDKLPQIIKKRYPVWRHFGPEDDPYMRAIYMGQGCWERLDTVSEQQAQAVLNKWGCTPDTMLLLEKLDRTALTEADANCGMFSWNGAEILPEQLRTSDAVKNMVIRNLGEIGLDVIHADLLKQTISVRLSPAVQSVLACTIFDVLERLDPYETLAKLMKKGMWTLELQRPTAYKKSMLAWEYLIELLHPWLNVRETAADETAAFAAAARDPRQAPEQKMEKASDYREVFLQEMNQHESFRSVLENAKVEVETMLQAGRISDWSYKEYFADGQWLRLSDADKLGTICLLYIYISESLKSEKPEKNAAEVIPNSEAIRYLYDAWHSSRYDERGRKGTVLQMIDAGNAADVKQFAMALLRLHDCCPDWASVITKPRLICAGYPSVPPVKAAPEPKENPEPQEAFFREMQQHAAFRRVFEDAKAEYVDLLQKGLLPKEIENKPLCVAQWFCVSELERFADIFVLAGLLFSEAFAGLAKSEIHVSTTKRIPNCLAISLFYMIWCRKMPALRVHDEGEADDMIELARALKELHGCYPKWRFSFGSFGNHAQDDRAEAKVPAPKKPEPHEAFFREMQRYAAFRQVFEKAKNELGRLVRRGGFPKTKENKPLSDAQWQALPDIKKFLYVFCLINDYMTMRGSVIFIRSVEEISNSIAVLLLFLAWCSKGDRHRIDAGNTADVTELDNALTKLRDCCPNWEYAIINPVKTRQSVPPKSPVNHAPAIEPEAKKNSIITSDEQYGQLPKAVFASDNPHAPMKAIRMKENSNADYYSIEIKLNDTIQIGSMMRILKAFETDEIMFSQCMCDSFDEDGHMLHRGFSGIDDMKDLFNAPSPYIAFSAQFCDRATSRCKFQIMTNVNSSKMLYLVDKRKAGGA